MKELETDQERHVLCELSQLFKTKESTWGPEDAIGMHMGKQ